MVNLVEEMDIQFKHRGVEEVIKITYRPDTSSPSFLKAPARPPASTCSAAEDHTSHRASMYKAIR